MKSSARLLFGIIATVFGILSFLSLLLTLYVVWIWSIPGGPLEGERRFYPYTSIEILSIIDLPVQEMIGLFATLSVILLVLSLLAVSYLRRRRRP